MAKWYTKSSHFAKTTLKFQAESDQSEEDEEGYGQLRTLDSLANSK